MAHVVRLNAGQPVALIAAPLALASPAVIRIRNTGGQTVYVGDASITPSTARAHGYPLHAGDTATYPIGDLAVTCVIDPSETTGKALYATPPRGDWGAAIAWEVIPA